MMSMKDDDNGVDFVDSMSFEEAMEMIGFEPDEVPEEVRWPVLQSLRSQTHEKGIEWMRQNSIIVGNHLRFFLEVY